MLTVANLFIILYDALTKDPENVGHGRDGYYFGIGKDANFSWYEVAKEIGTVLVELGIHKEAEPDSFTREELVKYLGFAVGIPWSCFERYSTDSYDRK